jgi:hypothetical protein
MVVTLALPPEGGSVRMELLSKDDGDSVFECQEGKRFDFAFEYPTMPHGLRYETDKLIKINTLTNH